jgi:ribosomal protein S18 acetylase RimI-like enzyme
MKFALETFATKLLENSNEPAVRSIYAANFARHNDADFEGAWHRRNRQSSMGLFYKATLIGFGIVEGPRLAFLAVAAAYRGSGAGSLLLEAVLATMDYCYLVPVNDIKVINWYLRHGFVQRPATLNFAPDEAHFIMERGGGEEELLQISNQLLTLPTLVK